MRGVTWLLALGVLGYLAYRGLSKTGDRSASDASEAEVRPPTVRDTDWYRCSLSGHRLDEINVTYDLSCSFRQVTTVSNVSVTAQYERKAAKRRSEGIRFDDFGASTYQDIDMDRPSAGFRATPDKPFAARGTIRAPSLGRSAGVALRAKLGFSYPEAVAKPLPPGWHSGGVEWVDAKKLEAEMVFRVP